jgi:hypothetical protein
MFIPFTSKPHFFSKEKKENLHWSYGKYKILMPRFELRILPWI